MSPADGPAGDAHGASSGPSIARVLRLGVASGDGYWEHDLASGVLWVSEQFEAMLGFAPGTGPQVAADSRERIHPDDLPAFVEARAKALETLGRFEYEVRYRDAAGEYRWMRGRSAVFPGRSGAARWVSGVVTEVQALKQAMAEQAQREQALQRLVRERTAALEAALAEAELRRAEAERSDRAKSQFLAHMSHEIRTPLNGVLGLTELALRVATSAEQRRFLQTAHESGRALLQLLSDVLDLSRIEAGRVELRERPFDPSLVLADAMRGLLPLARPRELLLVFDWRGDTPWVHGDDGALRQVVVNLLGNALKFTERGRITMENTIEAAARGRCRLQVRIADTGPGVPPQRRAAIFDPFVQGDDTLARQHGGAGLGLAIAQRLVHAMGGRITLECPADGGSAFTVDLELPVVPVPEDRREPEPPPPGLAWLVYQREPGGRWLSAQLERMGWAAEVIYGLDVAMERTRRVAADEAPAVVVVAEQALLPGTDLGALRAALPQACLHLLVRPDWHVPALEDAIRRERVSVLVAPVVPSQLRRLGLPPAAPEHPAPAPGDPAAPEVLVVEDNPVNQLLGREALAALGLRVKVVGDGLEAVQACLQQPPVLVLMDLQMPRLDGLEATRRLRALQAEGRWPGCPILALTAFAGHDEHEACRAAGMDDVLTKPLGLQSLAEQLAPWPPAGTRLGRVVDVR